MPWKIYLRHNVDAPRGGIFNDGTKFLLGVESSVRFIVRTDVRSSPAEPVARPQGTDLGQARPRVNLYPPTLIIGQMPMEHVQLMQSHKIQNLTDFFNRKEMSAAIQKQTTVTKTRPITDLHIRIIPVISFQLDEGPVRIKEASGSRGGHGHLAIFYEYAVLSVSQSSVSHIVTFTSIGIGESAEQPDLLRFRDYGNDV